MQALGQLPDDLSDVCNHHIDLFCAVGKDGWVLSVHASSVFWLCHCVEMRINRLVSCEWLEYDVDIVFVLHSFDVLFLLLPPCRARQAPSNFTCFVEHGHVWQTTFRCTLLVLARGQGGGEDRLEGRCHVRVMVGVRPRGCSMSSVYSCRSVNTIFLNRYAPPNPTSIPIYFHSYRYSCPSSYDRPFLAVTCLFCARNLAPTLLPLPWLL